MRHITFLQFAILSYFLAGCNNAQQVDMKAEVKDTLNKTSTTISKDGTTIAYEKTGQGPSIIVVNGALSHRKYDGAKELADSLNKNFSVIFFDRRGRGESSDTKPYAVEREIEDIEAIIKLAGGRSYLFGSSSGAALALLAAEKLGPGKVTKIALYEPPYESASKDEYLKEKNKVSELVKEGKPADAVTFFLGRRGMPPEKLEEMKKSPAWTEIVKMGHTLVYDFDIIGDGSVPVSMIKNITIPALVMDGEKSFDFVHGTADKVGEAVPGATRKTIKGQAHNASAATLAPVLLEFFSMPPVKLP